MAKIKGRWTVEEMSVLVNNNDKVLYGALLALYDCQTADEKSAGHTHYYNNAGFNGADSYFLSSVSKSLIRYGHLTDKQKFVTRKKIAKYMRQITSLANIRYMRLHEKQ